jgi:hypothetical protein
MIRRLCATALIAILFSCQKSSHQQREIPDARMAESAGLIPSVSY